MEDNDGLSVLDPDPAPSWREDPRIYIATPLTNLGLKRRRFMQSLVENVRTRIEQVTSGDRVDGEQWPVRVYAPIDWSAPWLDDGLSPAGVYQLNLTELLKCDALIVIAEKSASAGVGQEIEWAVRAGMPILYLYCGSISRQIEGIPADITVQSYGDDYNLLVKKVEHFLLHRRLAIQAGPDRRAARALRFTVLTEQLLFAWARQPNRTDVAVNLGMSINAIESMLAGSDRVAEMPVDTLLLLCSELGVTPMGAGSQLSIADTRALLQAAELYSWDDAKTQTMRAIGLEILGGDPAARLDTPQRWQSLVPPDDL